MMSKTNEGKIAVIGAGLGGLAFAAALKKMGMRADIYEQAEQFSRVGAGINVGPNASLALAGLDLLDKILPNAHKPPTWRSCTSDTGEILSDYPLGDEAEAKYGAPFLQMHRADLHKVLADAVPQEWIHRGKKLLDLKPSGDGVTMTFMDESTAYADAVVAADGVHSVVRKLILGPDEPKFTGRLAYRAVVPREKLAHVGLAPFVKWWGADRHIVTYNINPREMYFVTSVPADEWRLESWSTKGDVNELRAEYVDFHPHVQAVLHACDEVHKWALYDRDPVKPWSNGNVVMMGDAVHPMTPYMAQGAAMAMEDAVMLARCIQQSGAVPATFKQFESLRRERTSKVQLQSRQNTFLKNREDPSWLYSYDAWKMPLTNLTRA
jgi:6-hydroxynicotinate 3-monooxygenase